MAAMMRSLSSSLDATRICEAAETDGRLDAILLRETGSCRGVAARDDYLMNPKISLNEMRKRVGTLMFGASWIGGLTDEEYEFIRKHGPYQRKVVRSDGSSILLNQIEPCSQRTARNLDIAIGRHVRSTHNMPPLILWIQDHGFPVDPTTLADRRDFNRIARMEFRVDSARPTAVRTRGPEAKILPRVIAQMDEDLKSGRLTEAQLVALPDKELEYRYKASRERCNEALRRKSLRKSNSGK